MPRQTKQRFDLSCWYINPQRIFQALGASNAQLMSRLEAGRGSDFLSRGREVTIIKDALVAWLTANSVESLEKQLAAGKLREGSWVTTLQGFYHRKGTSGAGSADEIRQSYHTYKEPFNTKVVCRHSVRHYTSSTVFSTLRGRRPVMIVGYVGAMNSSEIELVPLAIAYVVPKRRTGSARAGSIHLRDTGPSRNWGSVLQRCTSSKSSC